MDNDKRKLTEKELKRKSDFEKFNSEMQQKGYTGGIRLPAAIR